MGSIKRFVKRVLGFPFSIGKIGKATGLFFVVKFKKEDLYEKDYTLGADASVHYTHAGMFRGHCDRKQVRGEGQRERKLP